MSMNLFIWQICIIAVVAIYFISAQICKAKGKKYRMEVDRKQVNIDSSSEI